MKKIISCVLLALATLCVKAQNSYDVMRFMGDELVGTAGFVGMGGAMSALGADISTIATNPAGIALYRSNDVAFSLAMNSVENKTDFLGTSLKSDKNSFAVNNLGLVFSTNIEMGSLKYVNFAFNYRRRNSFANNLEIAGSLFDADNNFFSQQYELKELYDQSSDYLGYEDYYNLEYPWLGLLTSTSGLIDPNDGSLMYVPGGAGGLFPDKMNYFSNEKGGVNDVDVNVSFNIDDMLYFGVTLSASNVDYTRYSEYQEHDDNYNYYTLQNRYNISGHGFGVKLGAIVRPFEYTPFKIGFAIHTPTWYSLTDCSSAAMIGTDDAVWDTRDYDCYGEDILVDYDFTTPWRMNVSASYTFDNFAAVDAEYELVNWSSAELEYVDGAKMGLLNDCIESNMKAQHIFRVGALFKLDDNFSLRCGYNYITAPFKKEATKMQLKMQDTSTEFENKYETNILTFGAGYAGEHLYFDIAYKLAMQKSDFYNYYDSDYYNPAATVKTNRNSLIATVGFRF